MSNIRVVLLRHGRSGADDEGVHEGRYDSPLTEVGYGQARERLTDFRTRDYSFDCIIASPLKRAHAVAEVMAEGLGVALELDRDWMEIDNAQQAGLSFEEAQRCLPPPAIRTPYTDVYGGGESRWDIQGRAARAVQSLVRRGSGSYLVVAHGGILTTALWTMMGAAPPVNRQGFWIKFGDTGYAVLDYNPDQHAWYMQELVAGFRN
jgi:2,3-bisphosphoglycerate-dependent phosphoglycerate mutase